MLKFAVTFGTLKLSAPHIEGYKHKIYKIVDDRIADKIYNKRINNMTVNCKRKNTN